MSITYEDLRVCHALVREGLDIRERMARLRSLAEWCTSTLRPTGGGKGETGDRVSKMAAEIADMEAHALRKAEAYLAHARMVDQAIGELSDGKQRMILRLRYLDGLTWEEVSLRTNYSERWVRKLHQKALEALGVGEEEMTKRTEAAGRTKEAL